MLAFRISLASFLTFSLAFPASALANHSQSANGSIATSTSVSMSAAADEDVDEEALEQAKSLYMEGVNLENDGDLEGAIVKFEEAYHLVPGKHGFAFKVGMIAWNIKDCKKADEFLRHFVKYAEDEKYEDKVAEAKQVLGEIAVSGCAASEPEEEDLGDDGGSFDDFAEEDDNPLDDVKSSSELREEQEEKDRTKEKAESKGLLVTGIILTTLGVGGLGMGIGTGVIAKNTADKLADASSLSTETGFPRGDFSCTGGDCPYTLSQRLETMNTLSIVGYAAGGGLTIIGLSLIIAHTVRKGKAKNARIGNDKFRLVNAGPTWMGRNGVGGQLRLEF